MATNQPNTWNEYLTAVEAELEADRQAREAHPAAAPETEPTEEEVRHAMRVEAHQIAGSVRLPKDRVNQPDRSTPAPIGPDSSSKDIAAQIRL